MSPTPPTASSVRWALAQATEAGRRHRSRDLAERGAGCWSTSGCNAVAVAASATENASVATISRRQIAGDRLEHHRRDAGEGLGVAANQPVVSELGASLIMPAATSRPCRTDAKARSFCWHADWEPPVSVPSAVSHSPAATATAEPDDEPPPGTRSGARAARCRRTVAEDVERNLVGDGLADERRAGIQQTLHRPGVTGLQRPVARPIGIAAARRATGDVEQVLGGESQPGEWLFRFASTVALAGDKARNLSSMMCGLRRLR